MLMASFAAQLYALYVPAADEAVLTAQDDWS